MFFIDNYFKMILEIEKQGAEDYEKNIINFIDCLISSVFNLGQLRKTSSKRTQCPID